MSEPMTLYVKPGCPCCRAAVAYVEYEGIPARIIDVLDDLPRYREELTRLAGKAVVPVFIQGSNIRVGFKNLGAGCGGW